MENYNGGIVPAVCSFKIDGYRAIRRKELMLEDEILRTGKMLFRKDVKWAIFLFYLFSVCTAGTLAIILNWPSFNKKRHLLLSRECNPKVADFVIVEDNDGSYFEACRIEQVRLIPRESLPFWQGLKTAMNASEIKDEEKMFVYRHTRFLHRGNGKYAQLSHDEALLIDGAHVTTGTLASDMKQQSRLFGRNLIDVPIQPIPILLLRECIHPFIIFQIWAVIVWCNQAYYSFASFIFVTAILSAALNLFDLYSNLKEIRGLASFITDVTIRERRTDGGIGFVDRVVSSVDLAPGHIVVINNPCKVAADMVIFQGGASVTEAMLTGEVTVLTKSNLRIDPTWSTEKTSKYILEHASLRNTLFKGTEVVAPRSVDGKDALAVVVRTGYETVKGRLILSILYPNPPPFKFLAQSIKFIGLLCILAVIGFIINAYVLRDLDESWGVVVQRGLDMVTIVVPPALPLAVTAGTLFAVRALRTNHKVTCISPDRINLAGKINSAIFDKTGTLTEDSLDLYCIVGTTKEDHPPHLNTISNKKKNKSGEPLTVFDEATSTLDRVSVPMKALLGCCQSLCFVNGRPAGDPLEVKTFDFSNAHMLEVENDNEVTMKVTCDLNKQMIDLTIARYFEFSPQLQRMGTLCQLQNKNDVLLFSSPQNESATTTATEYVVFHKGAPEVIISLCNPSTVPANFDSTLNEYTSRGLRVLAAAYAPFTCKAAQPPKTSDLQGMASFRAETEQHLTFLGLIVLENKLKPATRPTLRRLQLDAGIRVSMATGDNPVTAIAVGRQCGLVDATHNVYLGDVDPKNHNTFSWRNVDDTSLELDPGTLLPQNARDAEIKYSLALTGRALNYLCEQCIADTSGRTVEEIRLDGSALVHKMTTMLLDSSRVRKGAKVINLSPDTSFRDLEPIERLRRIMMRTVILARMTPEAKALAVSIHMDCGLYTLMVGDGANDAMALKKAHVGLSLSPVEASVAASFTSGIPDISNVIPLLLEGRGALAQSFSMFQFMALYSTIQFVNALLIVFKASFLSNNEYLWQDLFIILVLALSMGYTPSGTRLTKKRPSGRLSSGTNLSIVFIFICLTIIAQIVGFQIVQHQSFYDTEDVWIVTPEELDGEETNSWIPETATVFTIANFQYIACATIFPSLAMPWKKSFIFNFIYSLWMVVIIVFAFVFCLFKWDWLLEFMSINANIPQWWFRDCMYIGLISMLSYFVVLGGFISLKRSGKWPRFFAKSLPPHKRHQKAWNLCQMDLKDRPDDYLEVIIGGFDETTTESYLANHPKLYKGFKVGIADFDETSSTGTEAEMKIPLTPRSDPSTMSMGLDRFNSLSNSASTINFNLHKK